MRNHIERRRSEKGFTLIELLVVIVILGILAAVVVFAVGGIQDKGKGSACSIDTRTLKTAEEAYAGNAGNGKYTDIPGLVAAKLIDAPGDNYHTISGDVAAPPFASYTVKVNNAACGTPTNPVNGTTDK